MCLRSATVVLTALGISMTTVHAQVNVLTYHNDNARTGQNLNETILTPSTVGSLKLKFTLAVDGVIKAQPLYMQGLTINGGTHNVIFIATENDSVYAFDADTSQNYLWKRTWGPTVSELQFCNKSGLLGGYYGITGTPVINAATNTMYFVTATLENNITAWRLHALNILTGNDQSGSPVLIQAQVPGSGDYSCTLNNQWIYFDSRYQLQREGLLLANNLVYVPFGLYCEGNNNCGTMESRQHGWVMAYDPTTLAKVAQYASTPNGKNGGIWAGGAAPSADSNGWVYLTTGNGIYDSTDLGDSIIKLSGASGGYFSAADFFTPYEQGLLSACDADVGSGGAVVLPSAVGSASHPNLLISGSKWVQATNCNNDIPVGGKIFLIDRNNMGKGQPQGDPYNLAGSVPPIAQGVYGVPAYFNGMVYFGGSYDYLRAFPISNAALGTAMLGPTKFGDAGAVPSISANGTTNGIVWVVYGGNAQGSNAVLETYNAANVGQKLFTYTMTNGFAHFAVPTIANGKVYVGAYTNQVYVFGL